MKKTLLLLSFFLPLLPVFAQTEEERVFPAGDCQYSFVLKGDNQVRIETSREYFVASGDTSIDIPKKVTYTLKRGSKTIETVIRDKYTLYFDTAGSITLSALVQYGDACETTLTKEIQVFPYSIAYIGDVGSVKTPSTDANAPGFVADALEKRDILFHELTPPPSQGSISFQEFDDFIAKNIKVLEDSDVLVINSVNFLSLFDSLAKTVTTSEMKSLSSKRIFVISDINESFLSKILGQSIGRLGITEVSLVEPSALFELLLQITPENLDFGQRVSYSTESFSYSLSRFLDYLLYFGF